MRTLVGVCAQLLSTLVADSHRHRTPPQTSSDGCTENFSDLILGASRFAFLAPLALTPHFLNLFIFLNRRATQVRILFWDRDGYCVLAKRLEQGTFRRVKAADGGAGMEIDAGELAMLLEGIDAKHVRRRKRYRKPEDSSRPQSPHDNA
jgi:hypothetical protein